MKDFGLNIGAFCCFLRVRLQSKKKQCSCPINADTYALTTISQAFARHAVGVIARLDRSIQYSRDG
jgi:hypothetical protein